MRFMLPNHVFDKFLMLMKQVMTRKVVVCVTYVTEFFSKVSVYRYLVRAHPAAKDLLLFFARNIRQIHKSENDSRHPIKKLFLFLCVPMSRLEKVLPACPS